MTVNKNDGPITKDGIRQPIILQVYSVGDKDSHIKATTNGHSYHALIDTGADHDIINTTLFNDLLRVSPDLTKNVKFFTKPVTAAMANGDKIYYNAQVTFDLTIDGHTLNVTAYISDEIAFPLILGTTFLRGHNIQLQFKAAHNSHQLAQIRKIRAPFGFYLQPQREIVVRVFTKLPQHWVTAVVENVDNADCLFTIVPSLFSPQGTNTTIYVKLRNNTAQKIIVNKRQLLAQVIKIDKDTQIKPFSLTSLNSATGGVNEKAFDKVKPIPKEFDSFLSQFDFSDTCYVGKDLQDLKSCIYQYNDIFYREGQILKPAKINPYKIQLKDSYRIVQVPPFNITPANEAETRKQIDDLLHKGIIEENPDTVWSSPLLFLRKADGSYRIVSDFRQLNEQLRITTHDIPKVDTLLHYLQGSHVFSKIDVKNAFFGITLAEESRPLTGFCYSGVRYQYKRLPQGLSTSCSYYANELMKIFKDEFYRYLICYVDDIIIYSQTDNHLSLLKNVMEKLKQYNITLNPAKCQFAKTSIEILGHIVSKDGIKPSPSKCEQIKQLPPPRNVKEVKGFLGACSYFKKHVHDFSAIAKPLYELTRKNVPFRFDSEHKKAFETLKSCLCSEPIIALPKYFEDVYIFCDASNFSAGSVLIQKQDGEPKVIAYFSCVFNRAQTKWDIYTKEAFSLILTLKKYEDLLRTCPRLFIFTDSKSLSYCFSQKKSLTPKLARWKLFLNSFRIEFIHHVRAHNNRIADYLSRVRTPIDISDNILTRSILCEDIFPPSLEDNNKNTKSVSRSPTTVSQLTLPAILDDSSTVWLDKIDCFASPATEKTDTQLISRHRPCATKIDLQVSPATIKTGLSARRKKSNIVEKTEKYLRENMPKYDSSLLDLTVSQLADLQRSDETFGPLIKFLENNILPDDKKLANYILQNADNFFISEFLLYKLNDPKIQHPTRKRDFIHTVICIPEKILPLVLYDFHVSGSCHNGINTTYEIARNKIYALGLYKKVYAFVKSCVNCNRCQTTLPIKVPLNPRPHPPIGTTISMDLIMNLPITQEGFRHVLVAVENFSGFVTVAKLRTQSVEEIVKALVEQVFYRIGIPQSLILDSATSHKSQLFQTIMKDLYGVNLNIIPTAYHRANGLAEERIGLLKRHIRTMISDMQHDKWIDFILPICYAINICESPYRRGYSSFEILFGYQPNKFFQSIILPEVGLSNVSYQQQLEKVKIIRKIVQEGLKENQQKYIHSYNTRNKTKEYKFLPNDLVWLDSSPSSGRVKKFSKSRFGPFIIVGETRNNLYKIQHLYDNSVWHEDVFIERLIPLDSLSRKQHVITDHHSTPGSLIDVIADDATDPDSNIQLSQSYAERTLPQGNNETGGNYQHISQDISTSQNLKSRNEEAHHHKFSHHGNLKVRSDQNELTSHYMPSLRNKNKSVPKLPLSDGHIQISPYIPSHKLDNSISETAFLHSNGSSVPLPPNDFPDERCCGDTVTGLDFGSQTNYKPNETVHKLISKSRNYMGRRQYLYKPDSLTTGKWYTFSKLPPLAQDYIRQNRYLIPGVSSRTPRRQQSSARRF